MTIYYVYHHHLKKGKKCHYETPLLAKQATPDEQHDMLNIRSIGQTDLDAMIKHTYLAKSSTKPITRKKRLQIFNTKKVTKQRVKQLYKEKQLVTKCLKLRLLHAQACANALQLPQGEQYLELSRAIATETGIPNKGNKYRVW